MPISSDFPYPRRYNSLRLSGHDYAQTNSLYFITIDAFETRPLFGDITLAKKTLSSLLHPNLSAIIRVHASTLMPEHLHLLAGVCKPGRRLSASLGSFKSFSTRTYWKRSREIAEGGEVILPARSVARSKPEEAKQILAALMEWRASLLPEAVAIKNWPNVKPEMFLTKRLWHRSFHEHIIRNEIDLRETLEYIAMNPVKRGYVSKPQFYPFTGFNIE
jgi:REP element-mobilizing transposase RayT